jgi:anhydro-N-acetylmuramic acid kinase
MSGARAPAGPRRAAKAKGAAPRARAGAWESWVGVMSGTSLDGVDAVLAEFRGVPPSVQWRLVAHAATPFDTLLRRRLLGLAEGRALAVREAASLHFALGELYGTAVLGVLHAGKLSPEMLSGVTLSGQTVFHQSPRRAHGEGVSLQLGSGPLVAQQLGVAVVSDLRAADLAAGGEGAPLVPYADWLLFRSETEGRALLNVGGIANLTAFPAAAGPEQVVAFDTGPGNMVMDQLAAHFSGGRRRYDRDGRRAARGRVNAPLLKRLLADEFIRRRPPKTAGREQYGVEYVRQLLSERLAPEDLLATATAVTADSIAAAIRRFHPDDVVASGGGIHNRCLMARLRAQLPGVRFLRADDFGVPGDAKEAVLFAVLAYETWHGRPSNVPSATGARRPVVLGKLVR